MSHEYVGISWTPFKRRFDTWLLGVIAVYLVAFVVATTASLPAGESFTPVQLLIRATGTLAFGLLTVLLCIGPLARFTPRMKPLLYNRRHLGVATFVVALFHAFLTLLWYHGFSSVNPFVSLFVSNPRYDSIGGFPFESLGFIAFLVMFVMAATSHDFWNANLGPGVWKWIHMSVYGAYGLLVGHVALGAIQFEKHPAYVALLVVAAAAVAGLQIASRVSASGAPTPSPESDGWLRVGPLAEIPDGRAAVVEPPGGERIAVFHHGGKLSAVSNVCRHQGGPLGEGRIVDDCITCPWHGFQYRPEDGTSPPPFTEKIATYATRLEGGVVYVDPNPNAPGTQVAPTLTAGAPA